MARHTIILVAWVALFVASNLSVILWRVLLRQDVPWWDPVPRMGGLLILLTLTFVVPQTRVLRGFVSALTAFLVGNWIATLVEQSAAWTAWARTVPPHQQMLADMLMKLIPSFLMALTLIGSGLGRGDLFLVKGDLNAPSTLRWLGYLKWGLLGPTVTVVFALPLALQLVSSLRLDSNPFSRVLGSVHLAVLFAVINAASEEFRFRSVLLARLLPVTGSNQALLLTAVLFGIGHWFGHPSGLVGVLLAGFAGWIWGKSMLDTGGFAWAWLIHGIQDVVIYSLVVMTGR